MKTTGVELPFLCRKFTSSALQLFCFTNERASKKACMQKIINAAIARTKQETKPVVTHCVKGGDNILLVELLVFLVVVVLGFVFLYYYRRRWALTVGRRSGKIEYYVSATAPDGGDGSRTKPFRTILQALQRSFNFAVISVVVDGGVYSDNLRITHNTILTGKNRPILKCSILNLGGHDLTIKSLSISEAQGRAITHADGNLILEDLSIAETRIVDGDPRSGRAIEINGYGTVTFASLRNVSISSNEGHAILLAGTHTKVVAQNVQVEQNSVNPIAFENSQSTGEQQLTGAIEVADRAKLMMEQFRIMGNYCFGVLVRDSGRAHLRSGTVSGTKHFQDKFGHNLGTIRGGRLEVHNFTISNAEGCGLTLDKGYLKIADGVIKENCIGIYVNPVPSGRINYACAQSRFAEACLGGDSVQYINNQSRIGSGVLPISDPISGPCGTCPDLVPWE